MWNTQDADIDELFVGSPQIELTQDPELSREWVRRQLAESAARLAPHPPEGSALPPWLERLPVAQRSRIDA